MPSVGDVTVTRPALGLAAIICPIGAVAVETDVAVDGGETRQHGAVRPAEREVAAGLAADPRVVILEIFREHGSLQHAGEAAILARAPPADAEERGALIGRPRLQRFTDIGSDIAGRRGP